MPTPSSSEGGGNTTAQVVASGTLLPVGAPSGVTVDETTYNNTLTGSGKLSVLVFPSDNVALAMAISGDAFPRWLFTANPANNGFFMCNGTADPLTDGSQIYFSSGQLHMYAPANLISLHSPTQVGAAMAALQAPRISQVSPLFTITSGALPTVALVSGAGAQISTLRDAETVTPFTGDGTNNAATCAIALSPDNVTYSTLATISIAAALNLTGVLTDTVNCRVPAGWYLKLTAVHGTIGTTTYY